MKFVGLVVYQTFQALVLGRSGPSGLLRDIPTISRHCGLVPWIQNVGAQLTLIRTTLSIPYSAITSKNTTLMKNVHLQQMRLEFKGLKGKGNELLELKKLGHNINN